MCNSYCGPFSCRVVAVVVGIVNEDCESISGDDGDKQMLIVVYNDELYGGDGDG